MTKVIDTTKIGSTMYVYNGADDEQYADSWLSFNPNDPLPTTPEINHIPVGGAFFVKLRDAQPNLTITLTNDYRIHDNGNVNFGNIEGSGKKNSNKESVSLPNNFFQLVSRANGKIDKANYHWRDDATNDFDLQFDSYEMFAWGGDNPNVFFWAGDEMTSLQQEPETELVRVGYYSRTQGEVELSLENVTSFSEIILEDKLENKQVDILNSTYSFTTSANDKDRFVLYLKKQTLAEVDEVLAETKIYSNMGMVHLSFSESVSNASIQIFDLQGRKVKDSELKDGQKTFEIETGINSGIYVLRVNSNGRQLSKTIMLD